MSNKSPNFLTCPAFPELPPSQEHPVEEQNSHGASESTGAKEQNVANPFEQPIFESSDPVSSAETDARRQMPDKQLSKKKRKFGWWIFGAIVGVVLVLTVPAGIAVSRAGVAAGVAKQHLNSAQEKMMKLDIDGAKVDINFAQKELAVVRDNLPRVGFWRDLPFIGTQIRALEDATAAGIGTLDSMLDMMDVASSIIGALRGGAEVSTGLDIVIEPTRKFEDLTREERLSLLSKLNNQLSQLRLARDKMALALELWNRVPQDQLASPVRLALKPLADALPVLQRALDEAVPMIEVLLPITGYPEPHRFLVVLQNADELRPGGGFIGNVGTVSTDAGEITEFEFTDVYNIDNPVSGVWKETPPEPIRQYLGLNNWFLRDANWSPDFPTSADRVLDFYIRESELQAHAPLSNPPSTYVALEPGLFEALLRMTGPLTVDGKTFNAENFFEKLEFEVEVGWHQQGLPVEKRKEIVSRLGQELVKKLFSLPAARWPEVLDVLTLALERKQIMIYSRDPGLLRLLDARGWTARTKSQTGDFVWVVDANLAALKTDGAMNKSVTYNLDATDPQEPKVTVNLEYTNTAKGFEDYRYTRYRTYTRVYVPEGSELIESQGAMQDDLNKTGGKLIPGKVDVFNELGKTVYGAFWSIEPNSTGNLSFTYRLPPYIAKQIRQNEYQLDWSKQPGADETNLTVNLLFDKNIKSATPSEERNKWGDARYEYQTDSLMDRSFVIKF